MVKHTQTIRWQQPTNCLRVFDDFVRLALKGLRSVKCKANYRKNPENIIIHCGTNDISKDADSEKIVTYIINLSKSVSEYRSNNNNYYNYYLFNVEYKQIAIEKQKTFT